MADIVIKKKIVLDYLGEEHAADYLVFKAVPVGEYDKLLSTKSDDNNEALKQIIKTLEDKFVEGRFQEQDVEKSDMEKFDGDTLVRCFQLLTGQEFDPKV